MKDDSVIRFETGGELHVPAPRQQRIVGPNAPHGSFKFTQRIVNVPIKEEPILPVTKKYVAPKRHDKKEPVEKR